MINKILNKLIGQIKKNRLRRKGTNVVVSGTAKGFLKNVCVGNNVSIGQNVNFNCLLANVEIGNHVMIADDVTFITGNHRYDIIGRYMDTITNSEKQIDNDQKIVVEDDVWIGTKSIILKGVRVGKGSIIGAGSVVTKNIPPYSIVGGNPAVLIKMRFSKEEIVIHEKMLEEKQNGQ